MSPGRGERLPWKGIVGALLLGGLLAFLLLRFVASPLRIQGASMTPTLEDGSVCLVAWAAPARRAIGEGSIVLARLPIGEGGGRVVKRVRAVRGEAPRRRLALAGDNPARSRDSRSFGTLPEARILGVVVARVAPSPRYWGVAGPALPSAAGSREALSPAGR